MTLEDIKIFIEAGADVERLKWALDGGCRKVRKPCDSDVEYIPNVKLEGVLIEDCKRNCDCSIIIYQLTEEDKKATDWRVIAH